jgi:SAM-dependent methyltransferase
LPPLPPEPKVNPVAKDFSNTRYKQWPSVAEFLDTLPKDSLNGDIGCGNGKNMLYRKDIKFIGYDICDEFIEICRERNLDVRKGNIINLQIDDNYFDNIISIAVIHHLDKLDDRIKAIRELIRITKIGGRIMIYVWAFEQPSDSKRQFNTQDELVPYKKTNGKTHYRYYHLYKENELENEILMASNKVNIINKSYERGNWHIILQKI